MPSGGPGKREYLTPEHKRPRVAALHQSPCDDSGTGAQCRKTIEIDIVQHAWAVQ
jgi:hypothetical protein